MPDKTYFRPAVCLEISRRMAIKLLLLAKLPDASREITRPSRAFRQLRQEHTIPIPALTVRGTVSHLRRHFQGRLLVCRTSLLSSSRKKKKRPAPYSSSNQLQVVWSTDQIIQTVTCTCFTVIVRHHPGQATLVPRSITNTLAWAS